MIPVTGATGNVGRELVKLLLQEGAAVTAVTRNPTGSRLQSQVRVVEDDPSQPTPLLPALSGWKQSSSCRAEFFRKPLESAAILHWSLQTPRRCAARPA